MSNLLKMNQQELSSLHESLAARFEQLCTQGLKLNMARGVPAQEQLALSQAMLALPGTGATRSEDGTDCRNYGGVQGILEARKLFAPLVGVPPGQVVLGDNSSLAMMYDCIGFAWRHGFADSVRPWGKEASISFLCAVPGYDRHFQICEDYGIKLIAVPMNSDGPDIDRVREIVARDASVRGMWCVPKYSNPTGAVYSDDIIEALAAMPTAAPDFKLFWDNAYAVHHLTEDEIAIANVAELCSKHGHPDRALVYASTSKVTLAGAGVAIFGASPRNVAWLLQRIGVRTVGPDKLNQLRHVQFLRDQAGLARHMARHRAIMAPKFQAVIDTFTAQLGERGVARWTQPLGGYFISLDVLPGCARRVVALAGQAGVNLTVAGSPFPKGIDPEDANLRIAPSSPSLDDIGQAAQAIALCVLLAAAEHLLRRETGHPLAVVR